jgi:hypothetical protein
VQMPVRAMAAKATPLLVCRNRRSKFSNYRPRSRAKQWMNISDCAWSAGISQVKVIGYPAAVIAAGPACHRMWPRAMIAAVLWLLRLVGC